jgi:Protein of unknown function (DUF3302)
MNDAQDACFAATLGRPQTMNRGTGMHWPRAHRCAALAAMLLASPAQASLFQGDTLDYVANIIAWVALVVGPIVAIAVFWLVHILPEKIAEKRNHPQAKAIQTMCLLSLFFGGLLWPIAWLWAYTKPVLHKMAYGTDTADHGAHAADSMYAADDAPPADDSSETQRPRIKVVEGAEEPTIDSVPARERA